MGVESNPGDGPKYCCLWVGCKVYGKKSSSLKWLESHVPRHGGKFAYPCIVEGCRMRFSSQVGKINQKYFELFGKIILTIDEKIFGIFRA